MRGEEKRGDENRGDENRGEENRIEENTGKKMRIEERRGDLLDDKILICMHLCPSVLTAIQLS